MPVWICRTCAVEHRDTAVPPPRCAICDDERQWVPAAGQQWTTLDQLRGDGHTSELHELEPGLLGIGVTPSVGIGQRGLLVTTPAGSVLWDPPGYLDDAAVAAARDRGPLRAVVASHPHFYGVQVEWARACGGSVLVADDDQAWLRRPDPVVATWRGTRELLPGVTLVQCGGHFAGSAVLHWAAGAGGRGALLVGDTASVVPDRQHVTFMRSYPNALPLPAAAVDRIVAALAPYDYDRVYGAWWARVVEADGAAAVARSAERYLAWLHGDRAQG